MYLAGGAHHNAIFDTGIYLPLATSGRPAYTLGLVTVVCAQNANNLNVTLRDYTPYVKYARQQAALRRANAQLAARRERAWAVARQVAEFLHREYQPTRLVVFGSLVHPDMFGLHSDIDLAVDGIPWPAYLRAWNDVEERWPEFKVDLIDVGMVSERMRQRIDEQGQEL